MMASSFLSAQLQQDLVEELGHYPAAAAVGHRLVPLEHQAALVLSQMAAQVIFVLVRGPIDMANRSLRLSSLLLPSVILAFLQQIYRQAADLLLNHHPPNRCLTLLDPHPASLALVMKVPVVLHRVLEALPVGMDQCFSSLRQWATTDHL